MTKPTPEPPKIEMRLEGPAVPGRISVDTLASDPKYDGFWENLSAEELAQRQGVGVVDDMSKLVGDWPPDDSIDDFFEFLREVRGR